MNYEEFECYIVGRGIKLKEERRIRKENNDKKFSKKIFEECSYHSGNDINCVAVSGYKDGLLGSDCFCSLEEGKNYRIRLIVEELKENDND